MELRKNSYAQESSSLARNIIPKLERVLFATFLPPPSNEANILPRRNPNVNWRRERRRPLKYNLTQVRWKHRGHYYVLFTQRRAENTRDHFREVIGLAHVASFVTSFREQAGSLRAARKPSRERKGRPKIVRAGRRPPRHRVIILFPL